MEKKILDVTCGSRTIWFDKNHPAAIYCDKRDEELYGVWKGTNRPSERSCIVHPDVIADFTDLPFEDNSFRLVIWDPPHLRNVGENSWTYKKYGRLDENWPKMLHDGFIECMRVLKPDGVLIFKWAETQIPAAEVWKAIGERPLFGHRSGKKMGTFWACFMKLEAPMKNGVRPIDANATIEALRANFQQGSWYGCEDPLYQIAEDTIAEMPTILHTASGEPLTLEQLREMDGKPVRIVRLEDNLGWWAIVRLGNDRANTDYGAYFMLSDYGKTWLAYAYPPAHIDREAWESCPYCDVAKANSGVVNKKLWIKEPEVNKWTLFGKELKYCPICCRPLTEDAWAELEKRMGVMV